MHDASESSQQKDPLQKLGRFSLAHPTLVIILFILAALFLYFLYPMMPWVTHKMPAEKPVPVAIAVVTAKDVPVYFSGLGTVTPYYTITVKTQINGILIHTYFEDGQFVKAGSVIGEIDPRPYQAQVLQYQGQLSRDEALLANAKIDLVRYINLYKTHAVSDQTLETQRSLVKQDEGTIKLDKGQLDAAKTNLEFCKITSPVSGRIGISTIDEGNLVQTSDATGIAVITQTQPIEVVFPLPEDQLGAVAAEFMKGKKLLTQVYNRDQKKLLATGYLVAIDSQVDSTTGTVKFESEFQNKDHALFPQQFVNVNLKVDTLHDALVVPTEAVQQGASGPYVYRYNTNHTVSNVPVKTGVVYGQETVIKQGLSKNQIVVTEGTDKLFDGASVSAGNHA